MPPRFVPERQLPVACSAPPIDAGTLERYKNLIDNFQEGELKDTLKELHKAVEVWVNLKNSPNFDLSKLEGVTWRSDYSVKTVTFEEKSLDKEHVDALWDYVPWMRELDTLSTPKGDGLFDNLTGELRNCAFHLLWYCKELTLDRVPITSDMLQVKPKT
jgi:hypothetical protein